MTQRDRKIVESIVMETLTVNPLDRGPSIGGRRVGGRQWMQERASPPNRSLARTALPVYSKLRRSVTCAIS